MAATKERIEGVVIGVFLGFDDDGPLVVFPGNPQETALRARSLAELSQEMVGQQVALLFEEGDPLRPLIVGKIVEPKHSPSALQMSRDGERVRITAEESIELQCGSSKIILEKDGRIVIRGVRLTSQASGANNIRGGSINLN